MNKKITIALDAMGGDYGPEQTVAGAVEAARNHDVAIQLVGDKDAVNSVLLDHKDVKSLDITVIPSVDVIYENEQLNQQTWLYLDRAFGCDCHHRHIGKHAVACTGRSQKEIRKG